MFYEQKTQKMANLFVAPPRKRLKVWKLCEELLIPLCGSRVDQRHCQHLDNVHTHKMKKKLFSLIKMYP